MLNNFEKKTHVLSLMHTSSVLHFVGKKGKKKITRRFCEQIPSAFTVMGNVISEKSVFLKRPRPFSLLCALFIFITPLLHYIWHYLFLFYYSIFQSITFEIKRLRERWWWIKRPKDQEAFDRSESEFSGCGSIYRLVLLDNVRTFRL